MKLSSMQKFDLIFYTSVFLIILLFAFGVISFFQQIIECENSGGHYIKKMPFGYFCQKVIK